MFDRILVAFNGSSDSRRAFATGLALASRLGAELHVVSVVEPSHAEDSIVAVDAMVDRDNRRYAFLHSGMESEALTEKVAFFSHIVVGRVVEAVVELADSINASLIVVGGLGRSPVLRLISGGAGVRIACDAHAMVLFAR